MKRTKISLIIATLIAGVMVMSTSAFATADDVHIDYEHDHSVETVDTIVSDIETMSAAPLPYGCTKCYSDKVQVVCAANPLSEGMRTHGYGLFLQQTCRITSYSCTSAYVCGACGSIELVLEGRHHCAELHLDCGMGKYNVCYAGGW